MTITQREDAFARTHDTAESVLRAECDRLGARLRIARTEQGEKTRRYEIVLERFGREPLTQVSLYSVPVRMDDLTEHVRRVVKGAAEAVAMKER